jgi:hypothetical protein
VISSRFVCFVVRIAFWTSDISPDLSRAFLFINHETHETKPPNHTKRLVFSSSAYVIARRAGMYNADRINNHVYIC